MEHISNPSKHGCGVKKITPKFSGAMQSTNLSEK